MAASGDEGPRCCARKRRESGSRPTQAAAAASILLRNVPRRERFHTELIGSSPRVWLQEQGDAPAAPWAAGHPRGEAGLGRVGYLHSHAAAAASMARAPTSKVGYSTGANRDRKSTRLNSSH